MYKYFGYMIDVNIEKIFNMMNYNNRFYVMVLLDFTSNRYYGITHFAHFSPHIKPLQKGD